MVYFRSQIFKKKSKIACSIKLITQIRAQSNFFFLTSIEGKYRNRHRDLSDNVVPSSK